jgi:hypothetical protein
VSARAGAALLRDESEGAHCVPFTVRGKNIEQGLGFQDHIEQGSVDRGHFRHGVRSGRPHDAQHVVDAVTGWRAPVRMIPRMMVSFEFAG